jgi:hypothetical protein
LWYNGEVLLEGVAMTSENAGPVRGFLCSLLIGIFLLAIPLALWGAYDAWVEPVILSGKDEGETRTIIGCTTEGFCIGAIVGGFFGAIAGLVVATKRTW